MSTAAPALPTCPVCQAVLDPNKTCPRCRASEDWNDQIDALDFVVRRLKDWHQAGKMTDRQLQLFGDIYARRREAMTGANGNKELFQPDPTYPRRDECWSCKRYLLKTSSHCHECGAPLADPGVRSLRYLQYLFNELTQAEESGWLTLRQSHEFLADVNERIAALQRKLERDRAPFVIPVVEDDEPAPRPKRRRRRYEEEEPEDEAVPRRSFLEVMLDPHSIRWMLAAGGALIVLGGVIWLASLGILDNPLFIAIILGTGNAALLGGGYALILYTRHDNAGRALTLLACLVMPLNLWFYDSHFLNSHLWVAGVFCCIIYTASALLLKDSLFVYVLVAGVTLTGLLLLAQFNHFGEVLAPTTLLIVLGLICLHVERAFPPAPLPPEEETSIVTPLSEGEASPDDPTAPAVLPVEEVRYPFSRERFGMAFYWCSVTLFAVGLLLLLGAQLVGWMHREIFPHHEPFDVVRTVRLPWTLALVLAGTYAFLYSDLVVRKIGVYIYLAGITILWAEIQILVLTDLANVQAVVIIALALTALAVNLFQISFESAHPFLRRIAPLGLVISVIPVAYGVMLHFRATNNVLNRFVPYEIGWAHVMAMAVTALACRAGAFLYRHRLREASIFYFFLTAIATLLFAAGLAWMIGVKAWEAQAPLVTLIPILYLIAAYLYRGHTPENPLTWAAHGAVGLLIFFSLWVALGITPQVQAVVPVQGRALNLLLALFCVECAAFYGLAAFLRRTNWTIYLATVMLCGAIWQFLKFFETPDEFYTLAFALPGFALLIIYRFGVFEKFELAGLERTTFQSANALTTLGFVSGALLSLSRNFMRNVDLARLDAAGDWHGPVQTILVLLIFLTLISIASAALVQHQVWRRVHIVLSIINGLLVLLTIHRLSILSHWQQLEIFAVIAGLVIVGFAYVGWYYESERTSDLVTMGFVLGSLAVVMPPLIAVIVYRIQGSINRDPDAYKTGPDDAALIVFSIVLFASGIFCRIKATTLVGIIAFAIYFLVVLIGLHRHLREAWIIGIYLVLGGALLFGSGLFLSLYRDWLLALPARVRRREGIFRFFDWR
jgi:hypothetical protein